jgi:hypothetical protein
VIAGPLCAQQAPDAAPRPQQPSPEQMRQMMQMTMGAMASMMGPMTDAVLEAQLASAAKPETAERIATFKRNLYEALVRKGFTAAQALQIVLATAPPSAAPSAR